LICLLIFEISQPRSSWRTYLRILPTLSDIDPPFLWPERTLNLLNGSAARHYVTYIVAGMNDAAANVCSAASRSGRTALRALACDGALVAWAYAVVRTRSLEASDGAGAMLLPLIDLANHGPLAPQMHIPFARGSGPAGLVSEGGVPAGGEVRVRYGESSNANLLANYGFAVPDNSHDAVVVPAPSSPTPPPAVATPAADAAQLDAARQRAAAAHGLGDVRRLPRVLGADGEPTDGLLRHLRLRCVGPRTIRQADAAAAGRPVGRQVEACAWRLLARRAAELAAGYAFAPAAAAAVLAAVREGAVAAGAGGGEAAEFGREVRRAAAALEVVVGEQVRPGPGRKRTRPSSMRTSKRVRAAGRPAGDAQHP
jgi:hypothetical protein